jgi:hypothetical protein
MHPLSRLAKRPAGLLPATLLIMLVASPVSSASLPDCLVGNYHLNDGVDVDIASQDDPALEEV